MRDVRENTLMEDELVLESAEFHSLGEPPKLPESIFAVVRGRDDEPPAERTGIKS